MISFAALVLAAVLFKLLGHQLFTPLSMAFAGLLVLLRYWLDDERRQKVEIFLLQFGVLLYALANQDPSYYEHAALVLCLMPSIVRWRRIAQASVAEGSILLVLLYIVWSICWTSNADMSLAGFVMSGLCLAFLIGFVLQFDGNLSRIFGQVLVVLTAVMVGSWVVGGMGHGSAGKTFSGVTLHRNQLGFLLGLMILLCLFVVRFRFRWLHVVGGIAAAGLLVYIDSKSAIISIACTALLFLAISSRLWKTYLGALALGVVLFFTALPSPKMDHFALWMGRDPTFTSRTEIWADSVRLAADQPFTGYGYNAVWSAHENRLAQYRNAPGPLYAHAHNAWIDWVLQLGVGGLAVYLLFLGILLRRALDQSRSPGGSPVAIQAVCLLVYIQIYDLANVSTVPVTRFGFFMLAATTLSLWLAGTTAAVARPSAAGLAGHENTAASVAATAASRSWASRAALGLTLVLTGFLALSAFAIWEDGRRFAAAEKRPVPAANGVKAASYLDPGQFQWKTQEKLREYARRHRLALQDTIGRSEAP
jgi:O-antigen ligase